MSAAKVMKEAILRFREEAAAALIQEQALSDAEAADARNRVAAARQWVRETDLGMTAWRVYEEARPWPAWSQRRDWPSRNAVSVSDVEGGLTSTGGMVSFTYATSRWAFTMTRARHSFFDDSRVRAGLQLSVDGAEVFQIHISHAVGEEFATWRFDDVSALQIGPWVPALVEMDVILVAQAKRRLAEATANAVAAHANRIKLG